MTIESGMRGTLVIGVLAIVSSACSYTPTQSSPFTSPTTQTLSGTVYPTGTTTMWVTTTQAGTLSVALTSAQPAMTLGLSLGALSGGHCEQLQRANVQPGTSAQVMTAAEAGTYCVEVFDLGSVPPSGVTYSVSVGFH